MSDRKLSVDDILEEIERGHSRPEPPKADMQRVDEVIRSILTGRQEEELRRQNREPTPQERTALRREIESQTRSLTRQFAQMKKARTAPPAEEQSASVKPEPAGQPAPPAEPPPPPEPPPEEPSPVKPSPSGEAPRGIIDHSEISGHFGSFQEERQEVPPKSKTDISIKNYKEYKSSRNQKVSSFTLEQQERPEPQEERRPDDFDLEEDPFADEEFETPEQTEELGERLRERLRRIRNSLIPLGAVSINAFLLSAVTVEPPELLLWWKFPARPLVYALIQLVLLLLALLAGRGIFQETADAFRRRQPTRHVLCLSCVLTCLAVNLIFCFKPAALLTPGVWLYTPAAVLALFWNRVSSYQIAARALNNFRYVTGGGEKYAASYVEDLRIAKSMTRGAVEEEPLLMKNQPAGFFEGFLRHSFSADAGDSAAQKILAASAPLSAVLAVLAWFLTRDWFLALSVLAGGMVLSCGFLGAVVVSLPLQDAAGTMKRFSGMVPSWDVIEDFKEANAVLLTGRALFPPGSISLRGIKTFQERRVDDVLVDAASAVCAADSALRDVFMGIINDDERLLRPVDSIQYEDLMGMSAWVNEKRVLIGSRELMINHSIAVPSQENEAQLRPEGCELVYLAKGGELTAVFVLEFAAGSTAENAVRLLNKHGITAAVKTVDSFITPDLLADIFQTSPNLFKVLPSRLHEDFDRETARCPRADSMLGNNGSLMGYIVSLAVVKRLYRCIRTGRVLSVAETGAGLLLTALLLVLGPESLPAPLWLICFLSLILGAYWLYEKYVRV